MTFLDEGCHTSRMKNDCPTLTLPVTPRTHHRNIIGLTLFVCANNEVGALYIRHKREPSPLFEFLAARLFKRCFVNEFLL
jgi:hypothetical protein